MSVPVVVLVGVGLMEKQCKVRYNPSCTQNLKSKERNFKFNIKKKKTLKHKL